MSEEAMSTGDVIIAVLASLGVVVLVGVFVYVVKTVFLTSEKDEQ